MKNAPKKVRIGSCDYDVVLVQKEVSEISPSFIAVLNYPEAKMTIMDCDEQRVKVAFWHEAIHGMLKNAGQNEHDEIIVDAIANGLYAFFRDNQKALDWATQ